MFARRSTLRLFLVLASGLVLAERGTVVAMAAAGGIAGQWRRACWFFAGAAWDADALGLAAARLIVKYPTDPGAPVVVAIDGTFFQRWGKKVFQARWAYDGSAQGGKKLAFGNTWMIAAIVVRLRFCSSPVALPVLFRLWRGKGAPSQVTLAGEMMSLLVAAFPDRKVHGTGDAAFHGGPLVIEDATWTTRLPASAVLYGPRPPPTGKRGRPRAKGGRLGTCAEIAATADWQEITVNCYGQLVTLQAATADCLWYGSFKHAPGCLVLTREPGSNKPCDLGIFSLHTAASPARLIERYSWRWAIEMVFTQLAKRAVRPVGGGREHVTDLHVAVGDDDAVDEQLSQLPPLLEGGGGQAGADGLAECFDPVCDSAEFQPLPGGGIELALLGEQRVTAAVQVLALAV